MYSYKQVPTCYWYPTRTCTINPSLFITGRLLYCQFIIPAGLNHHIHQGRAERHERVAQLAFGCLAIADAVAARSHQRLQATK